MGTVDQCSCAPTGVAGQYGANAAAQSPIQDLPKPGDVAGQYGPVDGGGAGDAWAGAMTALEGIMPMLEELRGLIAGLGTTGVLGAGGNGAPEIEGGGAKDAKGEVLEESGAELPAYDTPKQGEVKGDGGDPMQDPFQGEVKPGGGDVDTGEVNGVEGAGAMEGMDHAEPAPIGIDGGGGAADALNGVAAIMPQLVEVLTQLVEVLKALIEALMATVTNGIDGGGPTGNDEANDDMGIGDGTPVEEGGNGAPGDGVPAPPPGGGGNDAPPAGDPPGGMLPPEFDGPPGDAGGLPVPPALPA